MIDSPGAAIVCRESLKEASRCMIQGSPVPRCSYASADVHCYSYAVVTTRTVTTLGPKRRHNNVFSLVYLQGFAGILTRREALRCLFTRVCGRLSGLNGHFSSAIVVKEKASLFATAPFSHTTPRSDFSEERQARRSIGRLIRLEIKSGPQPLREKVFLEGLVLAGGVYTPFHPPPIARRPPRQYLGWIPRLHLAARAVAYRPPAHGLSRASE
jgi:hypothetical protein